MQPTPSVAAEPPLDLETRFARGLGRLQAGDAEGARRDFLAARDEAPDSPEIHANLALAHERCGDPTAALAAYRMALSLAPDDTLILLNAGALLTRLQRFDDAEAVYHSALSEDPGQPAIWSNLGVLEACRQRDDAAEHCYRQALTLAPDYRNARFNLAYLLLRQGRYREGWPCLEARDSLARLASRLDFPCWQGEALAGRRILIAAEGGHGDLLHFCRYAALLKAAGAATVGIVAYPGLEGLLSTLTGVDRVLLADEAPQAAEWDDWVGVLSLPGRFSTQGEPLPASLPYLTVPLPAQTRWQQRLPARGRRRVGLVWQGNPAFANDGERSLPDPELLAPLLAIPGIDFFSLHRDGTRTLPGVTELGPEIADFSDSAAILGELDLLISVDTALAHLAGALARPCWLLLADYQTDWRWLTGREDSPWYPGVMRLFRQPARGDWPAVIDRVAAALADWADEAR